MRADDAELKAIARVAKLEEGRVLLAFIEKQRDDALERLLTAPSEKIQWEQGCAHTLNELVKTFLSALEKNP